MTRSVRPSPGAVIFQNDALSDDCTMSSSVRARIASELCRISTVRARK